MIYFLFFNQPLIQMYSGITKITQEAINIAFSGIEVHSSILSANAESKIPNEVKAIGRSLDCHLLIFNTDFNLYPLFQYLNPFHLTRPKHQDLLYLFPSNSLQSIIESQLSQLQDIQDL